MSAVRYVVNTSRATKLAATLVLALAVACVITPQKGFGANVVKTANPTGKYAWASCLDASGHMRPSMNSQTSTPLVFWMTKGKSSTDGNTVSAILHAMSCTDMPVPGVTVSIAPCGYPNYVFHLKRTRKLEAGETVFATKDGHQVFWKMYSAKPFTAGPSTLTMTFDLSHDSKGPFCITGAGATKVATPSTPVRRLEWS